MGKNVKLVHREMQREDYSYLITRIGHFQKFTSSLNRRPKCKKMVKKYQFKNSIMQRITLSKIYIVLISSQSPTGQKILTEIECTYKASLLKKKADSHNNPETLKELHDQASNTLEVLTMNMIATDVSLEHIFEYYKKITRENVIKLLLRCKKMYEARVEVKKILTLIIKKDGLYKWIMGMIGAE